MMFYIGGLLMFILLCQGREKPNEMVAVPQGMEDIYKILEKHNVYEQMKSWKRPTVSQRNTQLSSVLELSYQQLPKYTSGYNMGETIVKLFNDTNTGYVVWSLLFTLDLDYAPFITASIYHNGTNIQLNVNNCGKEICFLQEHIVNQQQLILIQHNSMILKYLYTLGLGIEISKKNRVFSLYDFKELGSIPENRLITYTVPDIQVNHFRPSSVIYDPTNKNDVKLFRTRLQTTLGDLGNADSIPRAVFKNGIDGNHRISIQCSAEDRNKTLTCDTSLDLTNNQTNDGTLQTSYRMAPKGSRLFWRIFIVATNEVYPITQTRPSPTQTIHVEMHPFTSVTSVILHSSFEIIFMFWERSNAKVFIHKLVNGIPVTHFAGFQFEVTKFTEVLKVRLTTYDVLLEDAGMYVVTVSTPNRTTSRNFTLDVYEKEPEVFEMNATNYTVKRLD